MPKRKRSVEYELDQKVSECEQELFRALKAAKGLERQRLGQRIQKDKSFPEKVQRLEREVSILKSLDLHQTAQAHLAASLVKINAVAENPSLPARIKHGAPKLDLTEEERKALHNVTSALYNQPKVREVVEKAINGVCMSLDMPVPEKRKRRKKASKVEVGDAKKPEGLMKGALENEQADVSDSFEGFSDHAELVEDAGEEDEEAAEKALSRYDGLLGDSDEGGSGEDHEALRAKYTALLGISTLPDEADDAEDESEEFDSPDEDSEDDFEEYDEDGEPKVSYANKLPTASGSPSPSHSQSPSPSPPPPTEKTKKAKKEKPAKASTTTFLPSLMGGYFSGSESASEVDVAPPKKRLGQRQRQSIAERKFGEQAKHVQKQAEKDRRKGSREQGWDMKRGAVDGSNDGRKPWKKTSGPNPAANGPRNNQPLGRNGRTTKPTETRDQGPLHPSWAAKKKQEAQEKAVFQGTKISF